MHAASNIKMIPNMCTYIRAYIPLVCLMGFLLAYKLRSTSYFAFHLNSTVDTVPEFNIHAASWRAEFRRSMSTQDKLDRRESFASSFLKHETEYLYRKIVSNRGHSGSAIQKWFIFCVASDLDGALLSANACASFSIQGVSRCVLVGLTDIVRNWWHDQATEVPINMAFHDGQIHFEWCKQLKTVSDLYGLPVDEETFWHIQGVVLYRSFLLLDMLHAGINVWLLDSDVVLTGDPGESFMASAGITTLVNFGTFRNIEHRAGAYSYPFMLDHFRNSSSHDAKGVTTAPDSAHLTLNNGVIAIQSNPITRALLRQVFDRVINGEIGDPQHPFNQLMFELGLQLYKSIDREDLLQGTINIPASFFPGAKVLEFSGIIGATAYEDEDPSSPTIYHAVGISGMSISQRPKIEWFRSKGLLFINV